MNFYFDALFFYFQVRVMLMIGWISFIISWCFNLLFYKLHPSSVDFDKGRFRAQKGFIHIRGRKKIIMAPKEENTVQVS